MKDSNLLALGQNAPEVSVQDQDGKSVSLKDFRGQKVVVFIYPRDNTPGCTAEACDLRDNYGELQKLGYTLLGLSPDTPRKHQNFIKKFDLPFPLLSDPEHELIEAFGAWGKKKNYGREYMGVFRSTFVLNEKGKIVRVIEKVKTKAAAAQLMEK